MKKPINYIFIIFLSLISISSYSQVWEKIYGEYNIREETRDIIETYDKGYLLLSNVYGENPAFKCWLLKTDINGDTLWTKVLKNVNGSMIPNALAQTVDNGFVVVGGIENDINTSNPIIIKLNACGEKEWCVQLYKEDYAFSNDVLIGENGNVYVLTVQMGDNNNDRIHIYCISSQGEVLWRQGYATNDDHPLLEAPTCIWFYKTNDNGFMLVGYGYYPTGGDPNGLHLQRALYVKVDENGNEEWILPYGSNTDQFSAAGMIIEDNNQFLGLGSDRSLENNRSLMMYFDQDGNELEQYLLNTDTIFNNALGHSYGFYAKQKNDGTHLLGCAHLDEPDEYVKWGMVTLDEEYNLISTYNNQPNSITNFIMKETYDGKLIQLSNIYGEYPGKFNLYLTKMNENVEYDSVYTQPFVYDYECDHEIEFETIYIDYCDIIMGTEEIPSPKEYHSQLKTIPIHVYPNPASDILNMEFKNIEYFDNISFRILNILGVQVYESTITKGQEQFDLDIQAWQNGLYIIQIESGSHIVGSHKFIKM